MTVRMLRSRRQGEAGQSLVEFALTLPFILVLVLGVAEFSYLLLDQHVATRMSREGANLISRDVSLTDAALTLRSMSSRPIDFDSSSKVIFSVLKVGSTTGSTNFGQLVLYQRYEYGAFAGTSRVATRGSGTFNSENTATNADSNAGLQVTSIPSTGVPAGGMIYVTEIFTRHTILTPLDRFGIVVPDALYSAAYF
jgi:Flp pilus assembly protein TadG